MVELLAHFDRAHHHQGERAHRLATNPRSHPRMTVAIRGDLQRVSVVPDLQDGRAGTAPLSGLRGDVGGR